MKRAAAREDRRGGSPPGSRAITVVYLLTLTSFLIASLRPDGRVWGIDHWAWLPPWAPWSLFGLGLLAALPLPGAVRRVPAAAAAAALPVLFAAAFLTLPARYHFGGDGYQLLSDLATGAPFVKSTSVGAGFLHLAAFRALGGDGTHDAVTAYRALSIAAGILFLLLVAAFARTRFPDPGARALFVATLATSGFAALFFGHVENYSLLALAVAAVCVTGAAAAEGRIPSWIVPAPAALAAWLHLLGLALAPAVVWLLVRGTPPARRTAAWSRGRKAIALVIAAAAAGWGLVRLRHASLFVRLTLVPFVHDRFTVDGYTLLSPAHLLDLANLALLLLPGLPVLGWLALDARRRNPAGRRPGVVFLGLLSACGLAAVALLDPKLGMARDWDAFAFAGVPPAFLLGLLALGGNPTAVGRRGAFLASVLGVLALGPRVVAARLAAPAAERYRSHLILDRTKSRNGWLVLVSHFENAGDEAGAARVRDEWERRYPERALVREAKRLDAAGHPREAIEKNREALRLSPQYFDAYNNLGVSYYRIGDLPRAREMLEIARVLNPGAVALAANLARVDLAMGDARAAERILLRALRTGDDIVIHVLLMETYHALGDAEHETEHLLRAGEFPDASPAILRAVGDHWAKAGDRERAETWYAKATARQQVLDASRSGDAP